MRTAFKFLVLCFALSDVGLACTCVIDPLSKRFREAEAIFIGRLAGTANEEKEDVQNREQGSWVLDVKKSFKGVSKDRIAVDFDMTDFSGACPSLTRLEDDRDYLIFAYGKDLKIRSECSDSRSIKAEYDWTAKEIARLHSFWFRIRARLWPF